ncbi:type III PLP-dependent enzyme [Varunaivibrio sulfuroxidans]|uniref:ornithine decarboxylase n=1 Tax=Varunaivibrio sulfuroxidans TaxID=1773489 RepID=A0A4R3J6B4_9PROT|nr:type III PLP-dependent enzyme [Varunaivibrio sulfuroxidans]TCS60907.1 ornithine decarboxylase [Varunaivibrio sulfuroxidans]WES31685.1 type III PLP-dependent enzyme [Varunaivibrio sulfuroxidans]
MPKEALFPSVRAVVETLKPSYPVYCLRPKEIRRCARLFLDQFPGRVLYATKCNPHPIVLNALYKEGIRHFDTASLTEVALIRESFPDVDAYFMHPVKVRASIQAAHDIYRVDHWVIDHENELRKIVEVCGGGDGQVMLVRLATKAFGAAFELSNKFGASAEAAVDLLRMSAREGFQCGLAFHVGSQCRNPEAFRDAFRIVKGVLEASGVHIHYLDVGGGFPVPYVDDNPPPLEDFVGAIKEGLALLRVRGDCVLMCEPGRSLVASGSSLLTQIQLRKENALYINDGIYHSLSETVAAHIRHPARLIRAIGTPSETMRPYTIFGPTCDSMDVLPYTIDLPEDAREGDWIEFGQAGAYTNATRTNFNGFYPETFVTVDDGPLLPA